jgi:hypothetical protein|tara:strand:- start:998 stop:1219 length:222 start_codon:yes stop_codon:yes gene_type:complete
MKNDKIVITLLSELGQWIAVTFLGVGIWIEITYKADVGYMAVTIGSTLFALATKYKYYKRNGGKRYGRFRRKG